MEWSGGLFCPYIYCTTWKCRWPCLRRNGKNGFNVVSAPCACSLDSAQPGYNPYLYTKPRIVQQDPQRASSDLLTCGLNRKEAKCEEPQSMPCCVVILTIPQLPTHGPHRRSHVICAILSALSQSLHNRHISAKKRSFVEGLSISLYLKPTPWYPDPPLSSTGPLSLPSIASNRYIPLHAQRRAVHPTHQIETRPDQSRAPPEPLLPRPEAALQRRQRHAHTGPAHTHHLPIAHKTLFAEKETPTLKEYVQGGQNKHRMYI